MLGHFKHNLHRIARHFPVRAASSVFGEARRRRCGAGGTGRGHTVAAPRPGTPGCGGER